MTYRADNERLFRLPWSGPWSKELAQASPDEAQSAFQRLSRISSSAPHFYRTEDQLSAPLLARFRGGLPLSRSEFIEFLQEEERRIQGALDGYSFPEGAYRTWNFRFSTWRERSEPGGEIGPGIRNILRLFALEVHFTVPHVRPPIPDGIEEGGLTRFIARFPRALYAGMDGERISRVVRAALTWVAVHELLECTRYRGAAIWHPHTPQGHALNDALTDRMGGSRENYLAPQTLQELEEGTDQDQLRKDDQERADTLRPSLVYLYTPQAVDHLDPTIPPWWESDTRRLR